MEGRLLTDLQSKEKEIEELTKNVRIREEIESTLVKDLHLMENRYNHMHNNCANLENKLKAAQTDNLNLEKFLNDVQQYDEKKVFELNRKIRVLKLEMERISLEKSLIAQIENYHKSREEKHKMKIEKLIGNYDVQLTEMRKIKTQISTRIESPDERKTEMEKLKKDLDTKLTTVNEQNGITQEKESFEKLQKYLQERKERHKVEDARIEQAMQGIEDLGKYLKERDEILFKKKKEVLEKQREDTEKTTVDRKYDDRQKDEGFKSVEKCQEGKKTDQSRQEKGLDKLSKNVNEKEENENVAKTRKDAKVVKVRSVSEIEFDNLLNNIKEKDKNKLIKDSSAKTKGAVTEKAKPVTTETIKETGNQMEIDEDASKNLFPDVSKEVSSQQIMRDDEYDFIFQVERTYLQSEQKARISNKNTFSQFDARIEKIKGTNEDKNDLSPKKIFTTGIRHYSRPKLQLRKW
ncbi:myb-like protein X [Ceratina calcarata]|uniref:Myb-like protein X n=1 Tax=Ceratina calcarata TaxID=156304 RepID=A0AAJ7S2I2_9HYME|nr:myb-like protein X [Ceratina calcarata]